MFYVNNKEYFITATDTDAGKTYVAQCLVAAFIAQNKKVAVYKPISAGCSEINAQLVNEDARLLFNLANSDQSLAMINPIAFKPAIAPHIAAKLTETKISINDITQHYKKIKQLAADITITEGAGGWRLPLGQGVYLSEFVKTEFTQDKNMSVILVVNMKLGCLNHALLTYQAIIADGLTCAGWVANCIEPMEFLTENLAELTELISAPCLGILDFEKDVNKAKNKLDIASLL